MCVCVCVCVREQCGWTALFLAAFEGHADCARLLLDAGADMNAKDDVRASAVRTLGRWRDGVCDE